MARTLKRGFPAFGDAQPVAHIRVCSSLMASRPPDRPQHLLGDLGAVSVEADAQDGNRKASSSGSSMAEMPRGERAPCDPPPHGQDG